MDESPFGGDMPQKTKPMKYRDFIIENNSYPSFSDRYVAYHELEAEPTFYGFDLQAIQEKIDDYHYDQDPCLSSLRWFECDGETLQVNDCYVEGDTLFIETACNKYATSIQGYHEPTGRFDNIDFDEIEKL